MGWPPFLTPKTIWFGVQADRNRNSKKKKLGVLRRGGSTEQHGVNGRRPEGEGRGAFYSADGTARRSFATDLNRISKRTGPNLPRFSGLRG